MAQTTENLKGHLEVEVGSAKGFGIVFAVVFLLIGLFPLLKANGVYWWALALAVIFLTLGLLAPQVLEKPNKLWHKFGLLLGLIFGTIVMALVFFLAVLPTGLIVRALGKDLLRLQINKQADSYWIERKQPVGSMQNQF